MYKHGHGTVLRDAQGRVKMRPEQGPWVPFNNICISMGTEQSA